MSRQARYGVIIGPQIQEYLNRSMPTENSHQISSLLSNGSMSHSSQSSNLSLLCESTSECTGNSDSQHSQQSNLGRRATRDTTPRQGLYWLLTISVTSGWTPPTELPRKLRYIRGQRELGAGGFDHWQVMAAFNQKTSIHGVKSLFGQSVHCELSRSKAARDYVWKEQTRVPGTQFELGELATRRNESADWDVIRAAARVSDLSGIPSDIYVRCYHQLRSIGKDHLQPIAMDRTCFVYWGRTGTGKSRDAWAAAGLEAYPKDPNTKFWDGYRGQEHVVIDEFRGLINISNLLRWTDRYPVNVEIKGSAVPLSCRSFWITSNLDPRAWYPELDEATLDALLRRLTIVHYQ